MMQPGDTARFTLIVDPPDAQREEVCEGFIQRVHTYETGALSIAYRYADNPRGISWSAYVTPENAARAVILNREPGADTTRLSMLN